MDNSLIQYGGMAGALVLIILILVRELVGDKNNFTRAQHDAVCNEKMKGIASQIGHIKETIIRVEAKVDDLPRKINGGKR